MSRFRIRPPAGRLAALALCAGLALALSPAAALSPAPAAASLAAGLSLYPSARTVPKGTTFTLDIRVDCGTNADGASTTVSFDTAYLEVVSLTADTSKFPNVLRREYNNATGWLWYDAGAPLTCHSAGNCPSGLIRIAIITFRAKEMTSPSTSVGISGQVTWSGGYIFSGTGSGSTVTITPEPTATSTPTRTATPTATRTPTPVGAKFHDADGDGLPGAGEPLLGGWVIRVRNVFGEVIYQTATVDNPLRADHGHWYLPSQLPEGVYTFEEVPQAGWTQTAPHTWDERYWLYWFGDGTFILLGPTPVAFQRFDFGNAPGEGTPVPPATATPTPTGTTTATPTVTLTPTPTGTATPGPSPTPIVYPYVSHLPIILCGE